LNEEKLLEMQLKMPLKQKKINKLYRGDFRYQNLDNITEKKFYEKLEKIQNVKKDREIYLEKLMNHFVDIPKKIPSIKEIEEKPFIDFMEELRDDNVRLNLKEEITKEDIIERKKYCQDLYEEISTEIKSSLPNTYEKNVDYIKKIRGFSSDLLIDKEKSKKLKLDEEIFGFISNLKFETNEKMMNFIGNYIIRIKLNIE
jgi:hypothetical protein